MMEELSMHRRIRFFRCCIPNATVSVAVVVLLFGLASNAIAQTKTGAFASALVAMTAQPDDLVGSGAIGGQIGLRAPTGFLVLGEYLYTGKDYYFYDGSGWKMAASWPDVPSGSTGRNDWLFYRSRHAAGLAAGYSGAVRRFGFFGAGGVMLNYVTLSDAADTYPEFETAATQSSIGGSNVLFSMTARGGIVYPAESAVAGSFTVMFQLEPTQQLGETRYLRRNTYFILGLTIQTGPILSGESS
jgi:hypothetical protein